MSERIFGKVVWFDPKKGYGFISYKDLSGNYSDIFVHFSDIVISGFKTLNKDQEVSFLFGKNNSDKLKAIDVTCWAYL